MIISRDISGRIDWDLVDVIDCIQKIAEDHHIPFFLVGAKARDIFFSLLYGIASKRATLDVDLGIKVGAWEEVSALIEGMMATSLFTKVPAKISRYRHRNGTLVDIVPFGPLEQPAGKIQWPATDAVMTMTGFDEAYMYAMAVRIRNSPILDIKICTPPAIVILKLIAWDEKYPERTRDAQDIYFIMKRYIEAGNDERLYAADRDLHEEDDFDYAMTSPRLLGRDIAAIADEGTIMAILSILDREIDAQTESRLIADMIKDEYLFADEFSFAIDLVVKLRRGIIERRRKLKQ